VGIIEIIANGLGSFTPTGPRNLDGKVASGTCKTIGGVGGAIEACEGEAPKSVCDYFYDAHQSILPIGDKLKGDVDTSKGQKIDKDAVLGHLNEIVAVLHIAHEGLHGWKYGDDLNIILAFKGAILTVGELAVIVCALLKLVVEILYVVIFAVGWLDVSICAVVILIGGLLIEILTLAFGLVVGLKIVVAGLVEPLVAHITYLKLTNILVCIGIKAN